MSTIIYIIGIIVTIMSMAIIGLMDFLFRFIYEIMIICVLSYFIFRKIKKPTMNYYNYYPYSEDLNVKPRRIVKCKGKVIKVYRNDKID